MRRRLPWSLNFVRMLRGFWIGRKIQLLVFIVRHSLELIESYAVETPQAKLKMQHLLEYLELVFGAATQKKTVRVVFDSLASILIAFLNF